MLFILLYHSGNIHATLHQHPPRSCTLQHQEENKGDVRLDAFPTKSVTQETPRREPPLSTRLIGIQKLQCIVMRHLNASQTKVEKLGCLFSWIICCEFELFEEKKDMRQWA